MSKYYCHDCAQRRGFTYSTETVELTGSQYQLEKYVKHHSPVKNKGIVSVFDSPDYQTYASYTLSAAASGSAEIDDNGRLNMIFFAGKTIGATYQNGQFTIPTDTIKVVLPAVPEKTHTYPVNSANYEQSKCADCGKDILI